MYIISGEELEAFLAQHGPFDRVVYTGDGSNDFCPILRLRRSAKKKICIHSHPTDCISYSQDVVCCRNFRGLEKRINEEGKREGLKAGIRYWAGAWEAEEIYNTLSI